VTQSLLLLILVALGAATHRLDVSDAVIALSLAQCAGALVLAVAVGVQRGRLSVVEQPVGRRSFFGYAWTIWLGAAAGYLLVRLDQLLMTPLSGVEQLGLYAVAVSISEVVLVANTGLREVIFSAESASRDPDRVAAATRLSNLAVFTLCVACSLGTPLLVGPIFGTGFVDVVPMVFVLLFGILVGNPGSVSGMALAAWGRPGLRSASIAVALVANVIGIVVLVPSHGGIGASFATLIGNSVAMLMVLVSMRRVFGVRSSEFIVPRRGDFVSLVRIIRRSR
jgi:O-antigen/teichoic acid export membrane protein